MDNNTPQNLDQNIQELLDRIRREREEFSTKTDAELTELEQGLDGLEQEISATEKQLEQLDEQTIEKIDGTVLDAIREDEEDEKEDREDTLQEEPTPEPS